jgi:hypothetical protein
MRSHLTLEYPELVEAPYGWGEYANAVPSGPRHRPVVRLEHRPNVVIQGGVGAREQGYLVGRDGDDLEGEWRAVERRDDFPLPRGRAGQATEQWGEDRVACRPESPAQMVQLSLGGEYVERGIGPLPEPSAQAVGVDEGRTGCPVPLHQRGDRPPVEPRTIP